jgi:hypothetical protein
MAFPPKSGKKRPKPKTKPMPAMKHAGGMAVKFNPNH